MFDRLLNRLEVQLELSGMRSSIATMGFKCRRDVDHSSILDGNEARIQPELNKLKDGITLRWETKPMLLKRTNFLA